MGRFYRYSDAELVQLFQEGETAAFDELYNRYWAKLYSSAYKRVRIKEVAEEIVQDFFTTFWNNREKLNIHTSFNNYVYSSVRYLVLAYFQKEHNRKLFEEYAAACLNNKENSTEELIAVHELERAITDKMSHLPSKCRSVFELSRKEHKTNKEIAIVLGISEKTVENHLTKALRILRVNLKYIGVLFVLLFGDL